MKTRSPFTAIAMILLLLSSLNLAPAGIRPGPPPGPLGLRPAAATERAAEARKPGPPPDPLKEGWQA